MSEAHVNGPSQRGSARHHPASRHGRPSRKNCWCSRDQCMVKQMGNRRELIAKSIVETRWCYGQGQMQYTPWAVFLIEFPGFLYPLLGFGTLVQRFRCHWAHFLKAPFPAMIEELSACKLLSPFGLSSVRSFGIHLIPGCKKEIWTIFLLASIHCKLYP